MTQCYINCDVIFLRANLEKITCSIITLFVGLSTIHSFDKIRRDKHNEVQGEREGIQLKVNVRKGSLKHQIADEIRRSIFRGKLNSGDKVTETQISKDFGASRGPVREAMQLLVMEGLLVTVTFKETKVASVTAEEVTELLIPIRINIEIFALRNVYPSWDKKYFEKFDGILEQMNRAVVFNDMPLFSELDMQFHELIIHSSNIASVENLWNGVLNRIKLLFIYRKEFTMDLEGFTDSHRVLLDAFKTGDIDYSIEQLKKHIKETSTPNIHLLQNDEKE